MKGELEHLITQAIELAEAGSFEAAVPLFQQAVQLDPANGDVHDMLAQCCMEVGQHDAAYSAACIACQLMPDSVGALLTLGRAARNSGRLKESVAAFQGAVAVQASNVDVLQELHEVEELRHLEVGHAVGLPGLRIVEAAANSQLGPGGVIWDSGILLAKLLVSCSQEQQQQIVQHKGTVHVCTVGCGSVAAGCLAGGGTAIMAAPGTAVPLPGTTPTFVRLTDTAAACTPTAESTGTGAPAISAASSASIPATSALQHAQSVPSTAAPAVTLAGSFLAGAHVLELGSGTGLVGITAACLGAHVVATDLAEVVPLLRRNVERNDCMIGAAGGNVQVMAFDWDRDRACDQDLRCKGGSVNGGRWGGNYAVDGDKSASRDGSCSFHAPDWILVADLVYSLPPVGPLVTTLVALVTEDGGSAKTGELCLCSDNDGSTGSGNGNVGCAAHQGSPSSRENGDLHREGKLCKLVQANSSVQPQAQPCNLQRKLLLAHKTRHEEVDAALLGGLREAGLAMRVVARDLDSRVTIYGNAAAVTALRL